MRSESSFASKICVCVNSEASHEPARKWTLFIIPRTKWLIKGSTQFWHFCFMRSLLSHMLIVIVQRRMGFASPPVFKYPIKWNHLASVRPNYFIFMGYLWKRDQISTPTRTYIHMNPLSRNPGSVTVVLAACSHVYLLACMQQCACFSGGARFICVWASVYRFSLCALGQKQSVRGVCEQRMPWLRCICTCSSELPMFAY